MQPIKLDLPYPSADGLTEDKKSAHLLSPAYAASKSELTAIMQYLFHHFHFEHQEMDDYAKIVRGIAICEMMHFDLLGSMLIRLGANPVFTANPPQMTGFFSTYAVRYSTHPQKMLMDNIEAETAAIEGYEYMLSRLENQQVAAIIQRIVMDEKLHLKIFTDLLKKLSSKNDEY